MKPTKRQLIQTGILIAIFLLILVYPKQLLNFVLMLIGVLYPFILGFALAYVLNILCMRLEKWYFPKSQNKWVIGSRRPLSIVVSLIIIVLVIFGIFKLVLPEFINALTGFFTAIPNVTMQLVNWLQNTDQFPTITKQLSQLNIDWTSIQSKVMKYLTTGVSGVFGSTFKIFSGILSGLMNFILAFTFSIYMLLGKNKLTKNINRVADAYIPTKPLEKIRHVLRVANKMFSSFIVGQVTEAVVLGTLCVTGMLIFRFPDAIPIGAFVGIMGLIPIFGAWIGAIVGFLLIVVNSPIEAILFIVFILVLQQIEGNLIYPRVVGTSIGLPGMWVLLAITVGSGLAGILGMFLGVPITATLYQLLKDDTARRLEREEMDSSELE